MVACSCNLVLELGEALKLSLVLPSRMLLYLQLISPNLFFSFKGIF